jgi:hypothetical protein
MERLDGLSHWRSEFRLHFEGQNRLREDSENRREKRGIVCGIVLTLDVCAK